MTRDEVERSNKAAYARKRFEAWWEGYKAMLGPWAEISARHGVIASEYAQQTEAIYAGRQKQFIDEVDAIWKGFEVT